MQRIHESHRRREEAALWSVVAQQQMSRRQQGEQAVARVVLSGVVSFRLCRRLTTLISQHTDNDVSGFNHPLQSLPVRAHPMLVCDVYSQDAFYRSPGKVNKNLVWEFCLYKFP